MIISSDAPDFTRINEKCESLIKGILVEKKSNVYCDSEIPEKELETFLQGKKYSVSKETPVVAFRSGKKLKLQKCYNLYLYTKLRKEHNLGICQMLEVWLFSIEADNREDYTNIIEQVKFKYNDIQIHMS